MGLHNRETHTTLVPDVLEDGTAPVGSVKTVLLATCTNPSCMFSVFHTPEGLKYRPRL